LAKPAIHRPQMLPANRNQQDFSCQPQVQAQRDASLQYIGFRLPLQGINSRRAPDNAPTRVDVASRYLGNKACKHETMKMSLPIEPQAAREVDYSKLRKFDLSHRTHNSCALPFSRRGVSASENISEVGNSRNGRGHQPKRPS
jgi:hypothetical protein